MIAFALGLDDHIPAEMSAKFGLGSDWETNPPTNYIDDGSAPA